jgi:hypothetical protein
MHDATQFILSREDGEGSGAYEALRMRHPCTRGEAGCMMRVIEFILSITS